MKFHHWKECLKPHHYQPWEKTKEGYPIENNLSP